MRGMLCALFIVAAILAAIPVSAQEGTEQTHVVQPGENLFRIAMRYGVTVNDLMAANGLSSPNVVYAGQVLVIPSGAAAASASPAAQPDAAPATEPAAPEAAPEAAAGGTTHTVARGETLFSIARQYGLTINAILEANGIDNANRIYAGQTLTIPATNTAAPLPSAGDAQEPAVAAVDTSVSVQHTVGRGETLGRIAQRYGVTVSAVMSANGIADPNRIYAGQTLTIPGVTGPLDQGRVYLDVPVVKQSRNLSCESASACSLLRYMGYSCSDDMVVFAALPRSFDNPHRGFVGSVDSPAGSLPPGLGQGNGYGVYVEALSYGLRSLGVASYYTYFASLDTLRGLLSQGVPVLIMATHGLGAYGQQPIAFTPTDGDGGSVTIIRYQHSYVLIGYDTDGFWAIDPWSGSVDYFTNARFEADWARLGRQALWVTSW
ncbi:MAG: LysM peptidoglycan-binding domain-containing protein [Anaerolineae bacterium]|nr:LysM peptidoglycan-binding domain-containing protein [Anaerolineae bacterium]